MLDWFGCYDERWQGILVPEAMAHPAKFSCGLISLLYDYGMEREWWHREGTIEVTKEIRDKIAAEVESGLYQRLE